MNRRIESYNVQVGECFVLNHNRRIKSQNPSDEETDENEFLEEEADPILAEATKKSKIIIKDAEEKAAEIIKHVEEFAAAQITEIENIKKHSTEDGYNEGFNRGYAEGSFNFKQEIKEKVLGLEVLASSAFNIKKEIIESSEMEILGLSTIIAEKILRSQLEIKPELTQKIIKAAIEQLKDKEEIKIIVNPALARNLYEFAEGLKETVKGLKTVKIIEDKTIPKDGVIVESPESRIDARIETQLSEITKNLMQEFSEEQNALTTYPEIEVRIQDNIKKNKKQ